MTETFSFGALLHQTTAAWRGLLNKRLKPLGLTQAKWRALLHLSKAKRPMTQCELAASLELEPATIVGLIDRLAKEGWVERHAGEGPDALMARADQALYRSKAAGKDIVSE